MYATALVSGKAPASHAESNASTLCCGDHPISKKTKKSAKKDRNTPFFDHAMP